MLPADLMGLNVKKFRQLNNIIKSKNFVDILITVVISITSLQKKKLNNSIIINYDTKSENLFVWKMATTYTYGLINIIC